MALGTALTDADGARHEMVGLLGLETSFARRRMHLGYRLASLLRRYLGTRPAHGCAAMSFTIRQSSRNPIRRSRWYAMRQARWSQRRARDAITHPVRSSI
jgi:cobyrinic acid a,c-diamide synthase